MQGRAQEYFSEVYVPYNTWGIAGAINITDTGYIVAGRALDPQYGITPITILAVNKLGANDSVYKYHSSFDYYPGSGALLYNNNSEIVLGGSFDGGLNNKGFLLMLDSNMSVSNYLEYGDTNDSFIVDQVKQLDDSGFILVGSVFVDPNDNDILLIKTDNNGIVQWEKHYNFKGLDRGWNVIQTPDHGFLIGGGGYNVYNVQTYNGLVIKTDSLGNEEWRKQFGGPYLDGRCIVANHPDGSFIVGQAYCEIDSFNNPHDSYGDFTITATKLDTSGNVKWFKKYDKPRFWRFLNDVLVNPDGSIYLLGRYKELYGQELQRSSLLKLNSAGDSIWYREYTIWEYQDSDNELNNIKATPDGGFVMCGEASAPFVHFQHFWVLKVDSFGCDTPGCHLVSIPETQPAISKLKAYPVPAKESVTVKLPVLHEAARLELFTSEGKKLESFIINDSKNEYILNTDNYPFGVYVLILSQNGQVIGTVKFVKL